MSYKIRDPNRGSSTDHSELLSRTERVWLFAEQHRRAVLIGGVLVCLVAIVIGAVIWVERQHEQEALILEYKATQFYLNRSLDEPETSKENLEKAITLFQQIIEEYPHTSSAELAWYFLGNARFEQENYPAAIEAYEHYVNSFKNNPTLLGLVLQRLGSAYILNGNRQKGLEAYTEVLKLPGALNKDQVLFELAKLEEAEDRTDQALSYYKQIQDQYPASPYYSEATMRIRLLEPEPTEEKDQESKEESHSKKEATPQLKDNDEEAGK